MLLKKTEESSPYKELFTAYVLQLDHVAAVISAAVKHEGRDEFYSQGYEFYSQR